MTSAFSKKIISLVAYLNSLENSDWSRFGRFIKLARHCLIVNGPAVNMSVYMAVGILTTHFIHKTINIHGFNKQGTSLPRQNSMFMDLCVLHLRILSKICHH